MTVHYPKTEWYGAEYLLIRAGSQIPRCVPAMMLACLISTIFASGLLDRGGLEIRDYFGQYDFAMRVLGFIFSYLTIERLNIAYSRYWEGVTHVKEMLSKWSDACMQVLTYDHVNRGSEVVLEEEEFCRHIVRLFKQLSAVAIMNLHTNNWSEFEQEEVVIENETHTDRFRSLARKSTSLMKEDGSAALPQNRQRSVINRAGFASVLRDMNSEEIQYLNEAPDPVQAAAQRICRAATTRQRAGGISAPPPLVSRIFQMLSQGILSFNEATKMHEVPMPFAFVQVQAALLLLFNILTPVAIACFSSPETFGLDEDEDDPSSRFYVHSLHVAISGLMSAVVVGSFCAMWMVANELEDPFGADDNDIDVMNYHVEFCNTLDRMLEKPWLYSDRWTTSTGEWVDPQKKDFMTTVFEARANTLSSIAKAT